MQSFIGIVPPPLVSEAIFNIQKKYGDNRTEPHITVIPPVYIKENEKWLHAVRSACKSFDPFVITLTRTGNFGKRVLFIEADSSELCLFNELVSTSILPFQEPANALHKPYHPHLTLGRLNIGFTPQSFVEMKELADALLASPIEFIAESVRIYFKPSVRERYLVYADILLGKGKI